LHEAAIKLLAQMARAAMVVARGVLSREREVRVRLTATLEATIYDRPGLWMDDERLAALQSEIAAVARAALPGPLNYGVFLRDRRPFENRLIVMGRVRDGGGAAGFNALPWLDVRLGDRTLPVMHFGLLVIHPRHQRKGLQGLLYGLGAFNAYHRTRQRPFYISNVTEVPAVFGAICDQTVAPYPSYTSSDPPPALYREIARAILDQHRHEFGVGPEATFDAERFVIQGSYTGGSEGLKRRFDDLPGYRVDACNQFCRAQLDYQRGDDFLQIARMDHTVISNWLTRRIPGEFRPRLARQMKLWTYPAAVAR
jgi:hypothetical protein